MSACVLIVEDNPHIREPLAELLAMRGYEVLQAGNGLEALEHLRRKSLPSLILLDLMMPRMDGWTFLEEKALIPALAPIPVIIMSAVAHLRPADQTSSIVATFEKVFDIKALVSLVGKYCSSALLTMLTF